VWLLFRAEAGRSYTVQFNEGLDGSDWQSLQHVDAVFYRRNIRFTDTEGLNARRFYRIITPAQN
jgi:hypothetical protein